MNPRALRIARVREEIAALRKQHSALGVEFDLLPHRAQIEGELEAKERELERLRAKEVS